MANNISSEVIKAGKCPAKGLGEKSARALRKEMDPDLMGFDGAEGIDAEDDK